MFNLPPIYVYTNPLSVVIDNTHNACMFDLPPISSTATQTMEFPSVDTVEQTRQNDTVDVYDILENLTTSI